MGGVDPARVGGRLRTRNVEVDDNRVLTAADNHSFHRLARVRIDLLVRNEGRHENKIARSCLVHKF